MIVFASVLALQVLIVALGVVLGYKRGIGSGILRLVELILIAVASLALGRALAAKIADAAFAMILPMLGEEIRSLIGASESIARAMVISWRWPFEMFTPSSERTVLYPSGRLSM